MSMRRYGITQQEVDRIRTLRMQGLTLRQIAERLGMSHDTVGKVVRHEREATRGSDGRMINHRGGRPPRGDSPPRPAFSKMLPRTNRERELADYWYARGVKEANGKSAIQKDTRKVEVRVCDFAKKESA